MQQTMITDIVSSATITNNESETSTINENTTAQTLVNNLLKYKFNGNIPSCESFLSECIKTCQTLQNNSTQEDINMGDLIETTEGTSFISPRGKFTISIYSNGITLKNAKNEIIKIPKESLGNIISFPKPEDLMLKKSKKTVYKMITFSSDVSFKNKSLKFICFSQSSDDIIEKVGVFDLNKENYIDIHSSSFRSENATYPNMPFVQCYSGVNLGALFPHPKGLLFFKVSLNLTSIFHNNSNVL